MILPPPVLVAMDAQLNMLRCSEAIIDLLSPFPFLQHIQPQWRGPTKGCSKPTSLCQCCSLQSGRQTPEVVGRGCWLWPEEVQLLCSTTLDAVPCPWTPWPSMLVCSEWPFRMLIQLTRKYYIVVACSAGGPRLLTGSHPADLRTENNHRL